MVDEWVQLGSTISTLETITVDNLNNYHSISLVQSHSSTLLEVPSFRGISTVSLLEFKKHNSSSSDIQIIAPNSVYPNLFAALYYINDTSVVMRTGNANYRAYIYGVRKVAK